MDQGISGRSVSGVLQPHMGTGMFEHDLNKLDLLRQRSADSFGEHEDAIVKLLLDTE